MSVRFRHNSTYGPNHLHKRQFHRRLIRWFRRPVVWLTALATAIITGAGVNLLTSISQRLAPEVSEGSTPFAVNVITNQAAIDTFSDSGFSEVIPQNIARPPDSITCLQLHDWAQARGGAQANVTRFRIIIQGRTDRALLLTSLHARIESTTQAKEAIGLSCKSAGEVAPRFLALDLDHPNKSATYKTKGAMKPFGFTLNKGETEIFDVVASTHSKNILTWNAVLTYTIDGEESQLVVEGGGRPFRTTGAPTSQHFAWSLATSKWEKDK